MFLNLPSCLLYTPKPDVLNGKGVLLPCLPVEWKLNVFMRESDLTITSVVLKTNGFETEQPNIISCDFHRAFNAITSAISVCHLQNNHENDHCHYLSDWSGIQPTRLIAELTRAPPAVGCRRFDVITVLKGVGVGHQGL